MNTYIVKLINEEVLEIKCSGIDRGDTYMWTNEEGSVGRVTYS